jgi:hypothetical protein
MAWYGTCDTTRQITQRTRVVKEVMTISLGTSVIGQVQRVNQITSERWIGVTQAAAQTKLLSLSTVGSIEDVCAEVMNDAGAWCLTAETVQYGTWF